MNPSPQLVFIGFVEKYENDTAIIRIYEKYTRGLDKITDFSHIIVLYWLHLKDDPENRSILQVHPRGDLNKPLVGVFATRSPSRPNPIGLCVCKLIKVEENMLYIKNLDAFVGSPILDIKPYIPSLDCRPNAQIPDWIR